MTTYPPVVHVISVDGCKLLYRSQRAVRAGARALVRSWLAEHPTHSELGSWGRGWKSVGPEYLEISVVRGDAARRIWAAEDRRLAVLAEMERA
jgi:hypothetical protein